MQPWLLTWSYQLECSTKRSKQTQALACATHRCRPPVIRCLQAHQGQMRQCRVEYWHGRKPVTVRNVGQVPPSVCTHEKVSHCWPYTLNSALCVRRRTEHLHGVRLLWWLLTWVVKINPAPAYSLASYRSSVVPIISIITTIQSHRIPAWWWLEGTVGALIPHTPC